MKRIYITENNIFDLIKIGKRIKLYYDDVNEGMYDFMPERFIWANPFASFLDVIDQRDSGCNGPDYEIKRSNGKFRYHCYDIDLFDFEIKEDKIIFDIMPGIGVQGEDLNNKDPHFGNNVHEKFFMTNTRSKDNINHLSRGSGSERLFIKQ